MAAVPSPLAAQRPLAERLFAELRRLSFDGVGITRAAFGPLEDAAHELIAQTARDAGLAVERDAARNLVVTLEGRQRGQPFIAVGSHLDSVPRGGNYDGAAGVIAGLLALMHFHEHAIVPARTIKLMALRGEESAWFGKSWLGSHALFGLLTENDLARPRLGDRRPLRTCFEDVGADVDAIARGAKLLAPAALAAFIEVHIEQGPVLEARNLPLGIVTGIYGNLRHMEVVCRGEAAHAGAVPRFLRHDAVVAIADLIMRMDRHWAAWIERGEQLVNTHGIIGTDAAEHAISRIPGVAIFSAEIRADNLQTLHGFHALLRNEAAAVAQERGVSFTFDEPILNPPATMNVPLVDRLERTCAKLGIPSTRLASGAGHDAAVFAQVGVPTAMLFIRNPHGSHNPAEDMLIEDFMAATRVLTEMLAGA